VLIISKEDGIFKALIHVFLTRRFARVLSARFGG
jgi:hypothetical protein